MGAEHANCGAEPESGGFFFRWHDSSARNSGRRAATVARNGIVCCSGFKLFAASHKWLYLRQLRSTRFVWSGTGSDVSCIALDCERLQEYAVDHGHTAKKSSLGTQSKATFYERGASIKLAVDLDSRCTVSTLGTGEAPASIAAEENAGR